MNQLVKCIEFGISILLLSEMTYAGVLDLANEKIEQEQHQTMQKPKTKPDKKSKPVKKVETEFSPEAKLTTSEPIEERLTMKTPSFNRMNFSNLNELSRDSREIPVNWEKVLSSLDEMPSGNRKQAIINALILAKKHSPFLLGGNTESGFDSTTFLRHILSSAGVRISQKPREKLSDTLMRTTTKVATAKPGDLVFYKGNIGSFGLFIIYVGDSDETSLGIGTLESNYPVAIYQFAMNPHFTKTGYFHVIYPDNS
jgi:cell wall-associated NlpC family hydrolase